MLADQNGRSVIFTPSIKLDQTLPQLRHLATVIPIHLTLLLTPVLLSASRVVFLYSILSIRLRDGVTLTYGFCNSCVTFWTFVSRITNSWTDSCSPTK